MYQFLRKRFMRRWFRWTICYQKKLRLSVVPNGYCKFWCCTMWLCSWGLHKGLWPFGLDIKTVGTVTKFGWEFKVCYLVNLFVKWIIFVAKCIMLFIHLITFYLKRIQVSPPTYKNRFIKVWENEHGMVQ